MKAHQLQVIINLQEAHLTLTLNHVSRKEKPSDWETLGRLKPKQEVSSPSLQAQVGLNHSSS